MIGQPMSQCPKASTHCLHQTQTILPVAAGGAYPRDLICCHCGQHVSWWEGGAHVQFHGPYAPAANLTHW